MPSCSRLAKLSPSTCIVPCNADEIDGPSTDSLSPNTTASSQQCGPTTDHEPHSSPMHTCAASTESTDPRCIPAAHNASTRATLNALAIQHRGYRSSRGARSSVTFGGWRHAAMPGSLLRSRSKDRRGLGLRGSRASRCGRGDRVAYRRVRRREPERILSPSGSPVLVSWPSSPAVISVSATGPGVR